MNWTLILLVNIFWPLIAWVAFRKKIIWIETAAQVGLVLVAIGIMWTISWAYIQSRGWDTEVLNGEVTGKARTVVSCEHSYQCNCYESCSGSGSSRSCTTICQTCYEHSFDVDWRVHTSVGDLNIQRVDRQGLDRPVRFDKVVIGEPVSLPHHYQNPILAAKDTILRPSETLLSKYAGTIPAYPQVFDYYRFEHVIVAGAKVPEDARKRWDDAVALWLEKSGAKKQVNVLVVFSGSADPEWAEALRQSWVGGKKNDVIVVIGVTSYPAIAWVRAVTISNVEEMKVKLRDDVQDVGSVIQFDSAIGALTRDVDAYFTRTSMKQFDYLWKEIDPPGGMMVTFFALLLLMNFAVTWFFWAHGDEMFSNFGRTYNYRYNRRY